MGRGSWGNEKVRGGEGALREGGWAHAHTTVLNKARPLFHAGDGACDGQGMVRGRPEVSKPDTKFLLVFTFLHIFSVR